MSTVPDTLVVGAGISGLAYAHARGPGADVVVLDAAPRAGGLVRTSARDGFRFEEGPELLPGTSRSVRALAEALALSVRDVPRESAKRFLQLDGRLVEVPESPADLATSRLLSIGAKFRLMAEATCDPKAALDGSIADFARHRVGAEALERLVDPLVAGIHAGDPEQLSLRACFPEVVALVEQHGSLTAALQARAKARKPGQPSAGLGGGLWKPAGGMQALVAALERALVPQVRLETPVRAIERDAQGFTVVEQSGARHAAARVVLASSLGTARALLADVAPEAAEALGSMQAENLVSIAHAYRREDVEHALDGFGYLVPRKAGGLVLGTLFSSTLDPESAPAGHVLLRSLLGGARHPGAVELGDEELRAIVARECAGPLGLRRSPLFAEVTRHRAAIPRFDLAHLDRRAALERALPRGLTVLGNFTRGIGLGSLVAAASEAAAAHAARD